MCGTSCKTRILRKFHVCLNLLQSIGYSNAIGHELYEMAAMRTERDCTNAVHPRKENGAYKTKYGYQNYFYSAQIQVSFEDSKALS